MSGGRDEVEQGVNTVVPEPRVTLDARLLRENVVVLAFEVTNYFLKAVYRRYSCVTKERN